MPFSPTSSCETCYLTTKLRCVTSQMVEIFIFSAVRFSGLMLYCNCLSEFTESVYYHHHRHQFLLLLVEHRASMKSFQALRSPAIPLTSYHNLPVFLISSSIVLLIFQNPILVFHFTPKGLPFVAGRLLFILVSLTL